MIQDAVKELMALGPLPGSATADASKLKQLEDLLRQIHRPVSNDDARALVQLFGPDDCFGLAWTLVHLIETAPGWPLEGSIGDSKNEWITRLKERAT